MGSVKGSIVILVAAHVTIVPDSGKLQEEDARRANRLGYTKHQPALPLYTRSDAEESLTQPDESKAIDRRLEPSIIISTSGMATGGRVLHHLARFLPDPRNMVVLVGYQAVGTRGRLLADGTDELKIFGQHVKVAAKIVQIEALSAHADYRELLDWLEASGIIPKHTFVTHGEPQAADALRRRLDDELRWEASVPRFTETRELAP